MIDSEQASGCDSSTNFSGGGSYDAALASPMMTKNSPGVMFHLAKIVVIPLSLVAISSSIYLAWTAFQQGPVAGCTAGGVWDCDHVLHSPWSKWMGIPVSIPAIGLHVGLISLLIFSMCVTTLRWRRLAESAALVCSCCAALAAVWFIGLQVSALGKFCKYCMAAHVCGVLGCGLLVWSYGSLRKIPLRSIGAAFALTATLVLSQIFGPQSSTAIVETHSADDAESTMEFFAIDFDPLESPVATEGPVESSAEVADSSQTKSDSSRRSGTNSVPQSEEDLGSADVISTATPVPDDSSAEPVDAATWEDLEVGVSPTPTPTPVPPIWENPAEEPLTAAMDEPADQPEQQPDAANNQPLRVVSFPGAKVQLKVEQWPLIGCPDAPVIMAHLFDYTCYHCRQMNRDLVIARQRFPNQLAVLALPVPLSSECNPSVQRTGGAHRDACELARLAIAVWRVDPVAFGDYHDWLCHAEPAPSAFDARLEAERRVDPEALRNHLASDLVSKFIAQHIAIYQKAGSGTLPKLFTESISVSGKMNSANDLCNTIKANHAL